MQQPKIVTIASVGGVAFNMLKDGSVRAHVNPQNAETFKRELLRLCNEIDRYLIAEVEKAKAQEQTKYVLPRTRIQELEDELARLKAGEGLVSIGQVQQPVPGMAMSIGVAPPAIPFNEDQARAQTIVRGGFEPDDGGLVRPTGPQL